MKHDLTEIDLLSENKIHLMKYSRAEYETWKDSKFSNNHIIKSSKAPDFLKNILTHKHKERPRLFFGEAFVAANLANTTKEGWFNSWNWISSEDWYNGKYPKNKKDPVINALKYEFYQNALTKYIKPNKFKDLINLQRSIPYKPEPPDLWLIDMYNVHHFIEVKRDNDKLSEEQATGLALIELSLKFKTHIIWLYESNAQPPYNRIDKYLNLFIDVREKIKVKFA